MVKKRHVADVEGVNYADDVRKMAAVLSEKIFVKKLGELSGQISQIGWCKTPPKNMYA